MKDWQKVLIEPHITIIEALSIINNAGSQIALIIDKEGHLLGTLNDGDVRRGLLNGLSVNAPVHQAMCSNPSVLRSDENHLAGLARMRNLRIHQIPIVDYDHKVVGLEIVDDFLCPLERPEWVVIMAGGLGSRLKELTRDVPKSMLKVGQKPILETIIQGFSDQGFKQFYLAVNFKAQLIEDYFGDGAAFGVKIEYLREDRRLGTAGALSLLPTIPTTPIFVTNADLLNRENYCQMIDMHLESGAVATMGVREFEMQVPFGVVNECNGLIKDIEEKPIQRFTVSAGMYVLSPEALNFVPRDEFFDMPSLFEKLVARGSSVRCYRIDGYWLDIGQTSDYERANEEFDEVFA